MKLGVGALLLLLGMGVALFGDFPLDTLPESSPALVIAGGIIAAVGMVLLLLGGSGRGGRGDEPPGFINP